MTTMVTIKILFTINSLGKKKEKKNYSFKIKLLGSQSCLTHPAKNSHPTLTQSLISELSQLILILD